VAGAREDASSEAVGPGFWVARVATPDWREGTPGRAVVVTVARAKSGLEAPRLPPALDPVGWQALDRPVQDRGVEEQPSLDGAGSPEAAMRDSGRTDPEGQEPVGAHPRRGAVRRGAVQRDGGVDAAPREDGRDAGAQPEAALPRTWDHHRPAVGDRRHLAVVPASG